MGEEERWKCEMTLAKKQESCLRRQEKWQFTIEENKITVGGKVAFWYK